MTDFVINAIQAVLLFVLFCCFFQGAGRVSRWLWRQARELPGRRRRQRFIGPPQFTAEDRQAEQKDWRALHDAILNEPVEGWITKDGKRPPFRKIVKDAAEGYDHGLDALEAIRQRGYISRRLVRTAKTMEPGRRID